MALQKPSAASLGSRLNNPRSSSAFPATTISIPKTHVIKSTSNSIKEVGTSYTFRQYYYTMINIQLMSKAEPKKAYIDSGYSITLINRAFLKSLLLNYKI